MFRFCARYIVVLIAAGLPLDPANAITLSQALTRGPTTSPHATLCHRQALALSYLWIQNASALHHDQGVIRRFVNRLLFAPSHRTIAPEELAQRYARTPGFGGILIGFVRDQHFKIQPVFSDTAAFESRRDGSLPTVYWQSDQLWNYARESRIIPLDIRPGLTRQQLTQDWEVLPLELRELLERGSGFITSTDPDASAYSVLMAVAPAGDGHPLGGRTGILLKDGLPIVTSIFNKEYVLEIKGVGHAEGGFNYAMDYREGSPQGTLALRQGTAEFENLEHLRQVDAQFSKGNSVRAVGLFEWHPGIDPHGFQQAMLFRFSPSSIRASFTGNDSFDALWGTDRWNESAYQLMYQVGRLLGLGIMLRTHLENLLIWVGHSTMTDFSDGSLLHHHPRFTGARLFSLRDELQSMIDTGLQTPGFTGSLQTLLGAFADGLLQSAPLPEQIVTEFSASRTSEEAADLLWRHFLGYQYYLSKRRNAWIPPNIIEFIVVLPGASTEEETSQITKAYRALLRHLDEEESFLDMLVATAPASRGDEITEQRDIAHSRRHRLRSLSLAEIRAILEINEHFLRDLSLFPYYGADVASPAGGRNGSGRWRFRAA
jgi:hypothetical protein